MEWQGIVRNVVVLLIIFQLSAVVAASEVEILNAYFRQTGKQWSVQVTLKHDDTGWEHYADKWRVVDREGNVLGERVLYHPHVNEQPFTRGLSTVKVPEHIKSVFIEAHDKLHGWTSRRLRVDLAGASKQ
jgi:hypothetical protein